MFGGAVEVLQSHRDIDSTMAFKVRTVPVTRTAVITDEAYMTDYPDMRQLDGLIKETALHVLLDAREKINEAIANLMGGTADRR